MQCVQAAQSPDLNVNDIFFFRAQVQGLTNDFPTLDKMIARIKTLCDGYDKETLEGVWQNPFKRYGQVSGALGWNAFEVKHPRVEQYQKKGYRPEETSIKRLSRRQAFGISQLVRTTKRARVGRKIARNPMN